MAEELGTNESHVQNLVYYWENASQELKDRLSHKALTPYIAYKAAVNEKRTP